MTGNDTDSTDNAIQPETQANPPASARRSIRQAAMAQVRAHGRLARVIGLVAVAAIVGAAYVVGGPPTAGAQRTSALLDMQANGGFVGAPAATGAFVQEQGKNVLLAGSSGTG